MMMMIRQVHNIVRLASLKLKCLKSHEIGGGLDLKMD